MLGQEKFHRHFTVDDGLPSNVVYKVIQDKDGFIYVCTEKGVAKFDGYSFKPIEDIKPKLNSNDVWELIIDEHDRKWFFTLNNPPVIMDKDKIYRLDEISSTAEDQLEVYYLNTFALKYGTYNKLLLLKPNDSTAYYLNKRNELSEIKFPKKVVRQMLNNDRINVTFYKEHLNVSYYDQGTIEKYDLKGQLLDTKKVAILSSHTTVHQEEYYNNVSNIVLFKDQNKLYKATNDTFQRIDLKFQAPKPFSIIGSGRLHFFVKSNDIIYSINKSTYQKKIFTKSIKGARQIFEDREKNIWISSQEDGMYLIPFHARETNIYDETNGLTYPKITAMTFDKNGILYLGNNYGSSLSSFDGEHFAKIPKENRKDYFVYADNNANIWLSGANLISRKKAKLVSNTKTKIKLTSKRRGSYVLNDIAIHPKSFCNYNEIMFFGRSILYKVRNTNNIVYIDSLWTSKNVIYALEAKSENELFIGTTNGVYFMNILEKKVEKLRDNKLGGNIRDLQLIGSELWIASDKHGAVVYDILGKKSRVITGLNGYTVSAIHFDEQTDTKWLSTNNGLIEIKEKLDGELTINSFTISQGIPTNEVNCCLTKDGILYVGTTRGLAILPSTKKNSAFLPKIFQTHFNVNSEDYTISSTYNLSHNQNHLIIELTALSFSSLGNITYSYKLEGADNKWNVSTTQTLEYPNLPPGNYTLLAYAKDANGRKTSNQLKININIEPPITQTWWFQLLALLLLVGLISAFIYWRSKEKNKKIELEKQFSNLKLEALQSQLNSHFIFNALNAIQAYIIQKDERQASKYMSQFAKLMRAFLDSSRNRTITIADEIEFIKTYVSLESIIYEGKFDSEIIVSPELDITQKIPSNITQPFVENAILHGLMPLNRKGNLSISFNKKNNLVAQCIITDDGVGYKSSQKTKTIKSKSHGQNIIHERIDILKKDHQLEVDIEIIDRKKVHNDDGTIIVINFKDNGAD